MKQQLNSKVYKELINCIGEQKYQQLHQANSLLDIMAVILIPTVFFVFMWLLATISFGVIWLIIFILQGFVLQIFGLAAHELFTHRKVLGEKPSYICSLFYMLPITMLPSEYYHFHMKHHRYLNTDQDAEAYKQDIDNPWKRVFILTFIGQLLAHKRKLYTGDKSNLNTPEAVAKDNPIHKKIVFEQRLLLPYLALVILLTMIFPTYMIYGYLLPLIIVLPIASTIRLVLEHADVDTQNPLQIATYYRTNVFTRLLFFYDSGDCHLVHHLFPKIPFYNIHKADIAIAPVIKKYEVTEHHSILKLLYGYFMLNLKHRHSWQRLNEKIL